MTIGTLVPGVPTTVTPDVTAVPYASVQGPAPDGPVVADDILEAIQVSLNVQSYSESLATAEGVARNNADVDLSDRLSQLSGSKIRSVSLNGRGYVQTNTHWYEMHVTGTDFGYWVQGDNHNSCGVTFEITELVTTCAMITGIGAAMKGEKGHAGLPYRPTVELWRWPLPFIAPSRVITIEDPSTTVGAYEAKHEFLTTLSHTVTPNARYFITVFGEIGGPGAPQVPGLKLLALYIRTVV